MITYRLRKLRDEERSSVQLHFFFAECPEFENRIAHHSLEVLVVHPVVPSEIERIRIRNVPNWSSVGKNLYAVQPYFEGSSPTDAGNARRNSQLESVVFVSRSVCSSSSVSLPSGETERPVAESDVCYSESDSRRDGSPCVIFVHLRNQTPFGSDVVELRGNGEREVGSPYYGIRIAWYGNVLVAPVELQSLISQQPASRRSRGIY